MQAHDRLCSLSQRKSNVCDCFLSRQPKGTLTASSGVAVQPTTSPACGWCNNRGCSVCAMKPAPPDPPLDALALVDAYDAACAEYEIYVRSDKPSSARRIEAKLKRGAARAALLSAYRPPDLSQWKALGIKSANEFVDLKPPRFDHAEQCIWIDLGSAYRPQTLTHDFFNREWAFGHMLRFWSAEDMRSFYEMLSRRPECTHQAQKPRPLDERDIAAYLRALLAIGDLTRFVNACNSMGTDRFGACHWCKRHLGSESPGHLENCELVRAVKVARDFEAPAQPKGEAHEADTREALAMISKLNAKGAGDGEG